MVPDVLLRTSVSPVPLRRGHGGYINKKFLIDILFLSSFMAIFRIPPPAFNNSHSSEMLPPLAHHCASRTSTNRRLSSGSLRSFACLLLLLCLFHITPAATERLGQNDIIMLSPGVALANREIKGGETDSFGVEMADGQCAHLIVQRKGIDLLVTVTLRDGTKTTYESPAGPESPIALTIIATTAGTYKVDVQPVEVWVASGTYDIELKDRSLANSQDEKRLAAERQVAAARSKQLLDTIQSRKDAATGYEAALVLWRELGDQIEEANTLHFLAQTYKAQADLQKCLETYAQVLERRGENDKNAKAFTLLGLAEAHLELGKQTDALNSYQQALTLFEAANNPRGRATALYGLGLMKARQQQMTEALKYYEQALSIYTNSETRDRHEEARTLHAMGGAYDVLGQTQQAVTYFQRALEGWLETRDFAQEGNTYSSLAKLEMDQGNWQVALNIYEKALELYTLGEPTSLRRMAALRRQRGSTLYNLAYVYADLGGYTQAIAYLDDSLALREPGNKGRPYMLKCYFLALANEPDKALPSCGLAIAEQERTGTPVISETYTAKGVAYAVMGQHEQALELYDKALAIQTNPDTASPQAEAITQRWRAASLAARGSIEAALKSYVRARELFSKYSDVNGVAASLIGMARAEQTRNNLAAALQYVKEATAIIEPLRNNVSSEALRTSYFATKVGYYELYIDLNMRLAVGNDRSSRTTAAFEASEHARARTLVETLARARIDGELNSDQTLASLISKYGSVSHQIQSAQLEKYSKKGQSSAQALFQKEREQLEKQLRTQYPRYAALMYPQPLTAGQVQKLLDNDTLLLEFALGEERSYVWAVTSTELQSYELPPRAQIEASALTLLKHLSSGQPVPGELKAQRKARMDRAEAEYWLQATSLSRTLLGQVKSLPAKKKLVIVADGPLQYLPFAALPSPDFNASSGPQKDAARKAALINEHQITNLPSASVLAMLRESPRRDVPSKSVAVFADPVFEKDDSRFQVTRQKQSKPAAKSRNSALLAWRDVSDEDPTKLPRLPASSREARQIIDLLPSGSSLQAIGFKANRETVTSKQLSLYRVVHFATHGILNEVYPERSGVVLSLYDEQGRFHENGYLRLKDIYSLNLPVDLVVLSACRTGLGKTIKGEGVIGLVRGFMYAGARRVLASSWKVDDDATAELMKRFYQKMLNEGMTPAAALEAAQSSMSSDTQWSHPYYWAGFILQGEPK